MSVKKLLGAAMWQGLLLATLTLLALLAVSSLMLQRGLLPESAAPSMVCAACAAAVFAGSNHVLFYVTAALSRPCRQEGGGRPFAAGGGCGGVSVRRTMAYCAGRYAAVFHPRPCRDGVGIRWGAAGGTAGQKEREASGGKAPQGGEGAACHRERAAVT